MDPTDFESLLLKAKSDALRFLSFKPRSVEEMREKLTRKNYSSKITEEVLSLLQTQGLLNDEKFARLFVNSRVYTRPTGKRQLEFDLKKKGLSKLLVDETIRNLQDYDEKKIVRDLVATRFQKMTGVSKEKKKSRIYGFLKRRGFNNDVIFATLSELFSATKRGGSASGGREDEIDENG